MKPTAAQDAVREDNTMKLTADIGKCLGYANCVAAAPEVYDLNGSVVTILQPEPPAALQAAARKGAKLCPVRAITVEES